MKVTCRLCRASDTRLFANVEGRDYWRCSRCQLTFLDQGQLPDRDQEKAQYDLHQNDPGDAGYRRFLDQVAAPLTEQLPAGANGLDYGCGPGPALAHLMRERGFAMALYDPLYHPEADVLTRQYDFVTCTEVIEHLHWPHREWTRFAQLVRPGGWLGLMTRWLTDDAHFPRWHYRRDPTHVCFWKPETFAWLARRDGWRVVYAENPAVILQRLD
ncbi:class I SAM-dependent methyltransferase [Alloalcanivorax xenomutans]|uniref:Class I SAM-dependent methyltransferase n=1 Tax=Alloalcanivorax xenomutans TaxID=1094342 RepID=A0A9Q3ZBU7_9GAMM|nr:class I SAM-dependent methyltransferase [Alloalcanivorax xenomutans]ARB47518.1 2-polyprenyl-3-methyl-5-hydroxy-6-metoxy-1,4-benzoquinol methylase [Alloalcanivorax xenomutans]MCE7508018.1 class I SAM-dependent methyltransferase [Alloalcanivorax xenomutans]WOA31264.1 class I SAM-dependent methyltransferase [Alloalcanivorax xenomutans]SOB96013.1 methyltransferase family protein [Alloalcanivorax xenomutans]